MIIRINVFNGAFDETPSESREFSGDPASLSVAVAHYSQEYMKRTGRSYMTTTMDVLDPL